MRLVAENDSRLARAGAQRVGIIDNHQQIVGIGWQHLANRRCVTRRGGEFVTAGNDILPFFSQFHLVGWRHDGHHRLNDGLRDRIGCQHFGQQLADIGPRHGHPAPDPGRRMRFRQGTQNNKVGMALQRRRNTVDTGIFDIGLVDDDKGAPGKFGAQVEDRVTIHQIRRWIVRGTNEYQLGIVIALRQHRSRIKSKSIGKRCFAHLHALQDR